MKLKIDPGFRILIENDFKIISNGDYHPVKKFNTHDISEGFLIYEKLSL